MKIKVYNIGSLSEKIKWFDENLEEIDVDERETPDIIGHRVVHGGEKFSEPTLLNERVVAELKTLDELAPLHNPPAIKVIEKTLKQYRLVLNYAVFDTAFYADLPEVAKRYPLPEEYYQRLGIRKFGFHGISHKFLVNQIKEKKVISLHLGGGASMTASIDKKPIETTMGFTPLDGLMMATRSGSIDPGIIEYLALQKRMKIKDIFYDLNFNSGFQAVSGISSDLRDIIIIAGYKMEDVNYRPPRPLSISEENKKKARLAIAMFVYSIKKFLGAFTAILNGVEAIIFSGEIGYESSLIREMVLADLDFVKKTKVYTIKTREEYQIAKEVFDVIDRK